MKIQDIQLREAAKRGDSEACLEMAKRLFSGAPGFSHNIRLGLAYLQQEVEKKSSAAILLICDSVPLEVLVAQDYHHLLTEAARLGSTSARLKLGMWLILRTTERKAGLGWIKSSAQSGQGWDDQGCDDPRVVARLLKSVAFRSIGDLSDVAQLGAREALKVRDFKDACYCLLLAAEVATPNDRLAEIVCQVIHLAASTETELRLPVDLVEWSLSKQSESGSVDAQYGLGCAFAGLPYGRLKPKGLIGRTNYGKAVVLLLRAADGGKRQAWLDLAEIPLDTKSASTSREMSRFFLEKAAASDVRCAQRKLGALLLKDATSLEKAEAGIFWLVKAADRGDAGAVELLWTLALPMPDLPSDYEKSIIEKVSALSPEMGARLALARAMRLTRHEAMTLNGKDSMRPWGLVMRGTTKENPKGRLVPAITPHMKEELARAADFFKTTNPIENSLIRHRIRTQREIFRSLSIPEELFFAQDIGRSLSHHGFGRHWAARAKDVLRETLDGVSAVKGPRLSRALADEKRELSEAES